MIAGMRSAHETGSWMSALIACAGFLAALMLGLHAAVPVPVRAQADALPPTCFRTGGGTLEICRDGAEAEGVFYAPDPCAFARGVQVMRLATSDRPGPLQVIYHGETPLNEGRGQKPCIERRAVDPSDSGAVRAGRVVEQLATSMPPNVARLWEDVRPPERPHRGRGRTDAASSSATEVGIGPRDPIVVAGRDWAGEEYFHVFLIATAGEGDQARRVQIQARTYDFETFDVRSRTADGYGVAWTPFTSARNRVSTGPAAVLDEMGRPIVGNCLGEGTDAPGLRGSISVVDQTYHYFYTDVVPEDCREPAAQRRTALYLRTARDLNAPRVWSAPRALVQGLPAGSFVRVAKAKGMERWVVSYACRRPANAPGGPVPDICLQYTADLSLDGIGQLKLYADPIAAQRSPAYLGLRSGGDGSGRYDRTAHSWMTDRYGNLETPNTFSLKAGFLTWLDRLAPRTDGGEASSLYGRPTYWATWTVRSVAPR
ncbi:hypothetical protein [Methylobacterium dankookense]|uniref:Uncharacterized protein n=1 Tax=Methylobacterium dankookense TaxID=560405 RepID=A0A564FXY6_9HYPH|nr:hypothetical protein [Methylobacterium dankookense]GJD55925.1 hypothetical protein IFDJLNFL_1816 [Methylobacterium dankookense]VUF12560.1 hypothetical protein MTDSW087_02253 [Methylobacterium dankookense]